MALFCLMSPGGSPGVTTSALAMTFGWGGRVLLAECDPKGGDVLSGFLADRMERGNTGLLNLALALAREPDPDLLWEHLISLDQESREWLLLPGLQDPRELAELDTAWDTIVGVLRNHPIDVVADLGRIGGSDTPTPLIAACDLAVLMLRPTLKQVAAARPRLDALRRHRDLELALCLIGRGEYTANEVSSALGDIPVLGRIPHDPRAAEVLADGRRDRKPISGSPLLVVGADLAKAVRRQTKPARAEAKAVSA